MNDENELDPEQDARVRALLADLGSAPEAATMPPEVAARLDETLAGLVAERADTGDEELPANVVPLRRRWTTRAAAAAAAVIVVGAGGVAAANLGVFGGAGNQSMEKSAGARAESQDDSTTGSPSAQAPLAPTDRSLPRVSAASYDADVARVLAAGSSYLHQSHSANERKSQQDSALADARGCAGPDRNGVLRRPVLYDGTPAVLLVHPQRRGTRLVEAWTCAGDSRLDSARVPVRQPAAGTSSPGPSGSGSSGSGSDNPSPSP